MSIAQPQILARHDLSIIDIDYLEDRLYDHNSRATGLDDGSRLSFLATDASGTQIGAIAGYTWAGIAEIKQSLMRGLATASPSERPRRSLSYCGRRQCRPQSVRREFLCLAPTREQGLAEAPVVTESAPPCRSPRRSRPARARSR